MKFIIQHNLINPISLEQISAAVKKYSIPHDFVGVIPFSHEIVSTEPLSGKNYLPYGSTSLTTAASKLNWTGLWFNPSTFTTEAYSSIHPSMLNNFPAISISEAITFFNSSDSDSHWFIRPTEDLKSFSGQVISAKEGASWLSSAITCESSTNAQLQPETMVVIGSPQHIQAEWRWFIVDGQIIDGSMYRCNGQLHKKHVDPVTDYDMIAEAQAIANIWLPANCCVMDTALVDGNVRLLEFNTINSSGFYDNNVDLIIKSLWDYFVTTIG